MPCCTKGVGANGSLGIGIGDHLSEGLFFELCHSFSAGLFALGLFGCLERVEIFLGELLEQSIRFGGDILGLFNTSLVAKLKLKFTESTDDLVALGDRFDHQVFRHFPAESFDHRDGFLGSRDNQVQIALLEFIVSGEGHKFAIDVSHADCGTRPQKRQG